MRVVSVLPSATEIVHALGHGSELVGRSSECDFPAEVLRLPQVMRPRVWDSERPSREIDARVRESRERSESLYELDISLLRELRPELLITQDLCGVCSVTEAEAAAACASAGVSPNVLSLIPTRLDEVWASVEDVGRALGDAPTGIELANELRRHSSPTGTSQRTVAVVEWLDPPILSGLWTPDIIRSAGGEPLGPRPAEPGQRTTWAELGRLHPDLVVLSPCSFSVERSMRELRDSKITGEIRRLSPPLGVYVADEAYFSRPGPRLAAGVDLVRELIGQRPPPGPMPVRPFVEPLGGMTA